MNWISVWTFRQISARKSRVVSALRKYRAAALRLLKTRYRDGECDRVAIDTFEQDAPQRSYPRTIRAFRDCRSFTWYHWRSRFDGIRERLKRASLDENNDGAHALCALKWAVAEEGFSLRYPVGDDIAL